MLRLILATVVIVGLAACGTARPTPPAGKDEAAQTRSAAAEMARRREAALADPRLSPRDRDCLTRGGQPATAGLSGEWMCAMPHADAGKSCREGSECDGDCILDETPGRPRPQPGQPATGSCQAYAYPYGCRDQVEQGRFVGTLCID